MTETERANHSATVTPPAPRSSNLTARALSAVVGLPILLFFSFIGGPPGYEGLPFAFGVAVCALTGGFEYLRAARRRGYRPSERVAYLCLLLLPLAVWALCRGKSGVFLPAVFSFLVLGTVFHQATRPPDPERNAILVDAAVSLLGVVYVGWLFCYMVFLHGIPGTINVPLPFFTLPEMPRGSWLVLYMIAVSWWSDMGAFFVGRRWGRRPLAPHLSPGKTREGAVGAVFGGVFMSLLWGTWIHIPLLHCLILGALLGALAQVGDLCESALKRGFGVKDFGSLLPGHGGLLDRFDSVLFNAPVAYYYILAFLS